MKNHRLLYISFGWLALLGAIHILAGFFYFYWTIWWFDNAMHFLGGLSMAFFSLWIVHVADIFKGVPSPSKVLLATVASVAVIGLGWEVFEYVFGIANPSIGQTYAADTSSDLLFDFLGALVAGFYARKPRFYLEKKNG